MFTSIQKSVALLALIRSHRDPQELAQFFSIKMAARTRRAQEANEEWYQDGYSSSDVNDATNYLARPRRSVQESESKTDGGDAATNNSLIVIRNNIGLLLIEDKNSETDDYPAKDNLPRNRNNSGLVLIEDVESESDGQPATDDLFQYQPLTIEEIHSDDNLATNDPSQNQPTIEENSSSDTDVDATAMQSVLDGRLRRIQMIARNFMNFMGAGPVRGNESETDDEDVLGDLRRRLGPVRGNESETDGEDVSGYFLRRHAPPVRENESEIENDSETDRHQRRGLGDSERHFYECALRSITNKIREAVVLAVTHDPDHARSLAFKEECLRLLEIYGNARQQ